METQEILRNNTTSTYQGYVLQSIGYSYYTKQELNLFRKLKKIPAKISAFLHRNKILSVYKSDCFADKRDDYYLILTIDGTIFQVDY